MKTKLHLPLIITLTLVWLILSIGVNVALSAWQPIIGIPEPPFGITTTHMMYADPSYTYDYGNGPEPYRIGPNGPYTHYIDPDHPNATDTDNPYGTHAMPRVTRPNAIAHLPPGSVIEMHSGLQPGVGPIYGSGTPSKPIFIRGVPGDEPTFDSIFSINGDYIVMENIKFDLGTYARRTILIGYYEGARTHIAIRGCEFYNGMYDPNQSYQVIRIKYSFDSPDQLKNIVIYNNHFHYIGHGRTTETKCDVVGVSVDANAKDIWIVDNYMHHLGGDGIQVAYDSYSANTIIPNHIYIGRNTFHDNYENAIDLKICEDVIVSQNVAYNFGEGYCDIGGGSSIAFRYGLGEGPDDINRNNIWTLFNLAYNVNSQDGAFASFIGVGEKLADEIYYIGNIAYNCHNSDGNSTAFGSSGQEKIYWVNNTAYNCDQGGQFWIANDDPNQNITLTNNIFSESGSSIRGYLVIGTKTQGPSDFANLTMSNNLFYQDSGPGKLSFYEWYDPRQRLEYIEYAIDEFKQAKPDKAQGTFEANPNFVDAINGDFHLQSNSPAIDAGTVHDYFDRFFNLYGVDISVDLDGNPIPQGCAPDIGADEYRLEDILADKIGLTCYNNVFNPVRGERALIVMELPKQARVRLGLYNTRGKKIIELADEEKEAGRHKYYWDGKSSNGDIVGSGLYFVHMQAVDCKKTKKIVVVK